MHWDLKNPFAKIEPPLHKEPQIRYLLLSEIRRLLDYLNSYKTKFLVLYDSEKTTLVNRASVANARESD